MNTISRHFLTAGTYLLLSSGIAQAQFTKIDVPGAKSTNAYGIDGNNAVGRYRDSNYVYHGYVYNSVTKNITTLDNPAAVNDGYYGTFAEDIDGNNITGFYFDNNGTGEHSFFYDGNTYVNFDVPGATNGTEAYGISGDKVVGTSYGPNYVRQGFLYEHGNITVIDVPGAAVTSADGIDGNNIVGYYFDANAEHGFLYDGSTYTDLDYPGAINTYLYGISGNTIVGAYYAPDNTIHSFYYRDGIYTGFDIPGETFGEAIGISGNTVSGTYVDDSGAHGYLYALPAAVPEPGSVALLVGLSASGVGLLARRRKIRSRRTGDRRN